MNSEKGRVGAYRCQALADLITKRGHLIEKGANISDLYDFGKKLYDKRETIKKRNIDRDLGRAIKNQKR